MIYVDKFDVNPNDTEYKNIYVVGSILSRLQANPYEFLRVEILLSDGCKWYDPTLKNSAHEMKGSTKIIFVFLKAVRIQEQETSVIVPLWLDELIKKSNTIPVPFLRISKVDEPSCVDATSIILNKVYQKPWYPTSMGLNQCSKRGGIYEECLSKWLYNVEMSMGNDIVQEGCLVPVPLRRSFCIFRVSEIYRYCSRLYDCSTCSIGTTKYKIGQPLGDNTICRSISSVAYIYKSETSLILEKIKFFSERDVGFCGILVCAKPGSLLSQFSNYILSVLDTSIIKINFTGDELKCHSKMKTNLRRSVLRATEGLPVVINIEEICDALEVLGDKLIDELITIKHRVIIFATSSTPANELRKKCSKLDMVFPIILNLYTVSDPTISRSILWAKYCAINCKCKIPSEKCKMFASDVSNADIYLGTLFKNASNFMQGYTLQEIEMTMIGALQCSFLRSSGCCFENLNTWNNLPMIGSNEIEPILESDIVSALKEARLDHRYKRVDKAKISDIAGYKEIKDRLLLILNILGKNDLRKRLGVKIPKGILLHGPSGCGKSVMARAIISESGINNICISASDIYSKYFGESEAIIRDVFVTARGISPCIIFIDSIETIAGKRDWSSKDTGKQVDDRVLSMLLNELDGASSMHGVILFACVTETNLLDDALLRPGRLDYHSHIPLPDLNDRREILKLYFSKARIMCGKSLEIPDRNDYIFLKTIDDISNITNGFTGADLEALIKESILDSIITGNNSVTIENVIKSINRGYKGYGHSLLNNEIYMWPL